MTAAVAQPLPPAGDTLPDVSPGLVIVMLREMEAAGLAAPGSLEAWAKDRYPELQLPDAGAALPSRPPSTEVDERVHSMRLAEAKRRARQP